MADEVLQALRVAKAAELRRAVSTLRRSSMPLKDLIPLLQETADLLDLLGPPGSARELAQSIIDDVAEARRI